jgi:hypothetical protein
MMRCDRITDLLDTAYQPDGVIWCVQGDALSSKYIMYNFVRGVQRVVYRGLVSNSTRDNGLEEDVSRPLLDFYAVHGYPLGLDQLVDQLFWITPGYSATNSMY